MSAFLEGKRGSVCSAVMYPDFGESVKLVLSLVGKCAVASSFSVIYLYSAELFPTEVRYIMGSWNKAKSVIDYT